MLLSYLNIKEIMVRMLTKVLLVLLVSTIGLIFTSGNVARAEGSEVTPSFSLRYQNLPDDIFVGEGFINNGTSGFRIYAEPNDELVFHKIAIFIDESIEPVDQRIYDASSNEYYLSSNTSSGAELAALLPEGPHEIHFRYQLEEGGEFVDYQNFLLISNYSDPTGVLSYITQDAKMRLKIGDFIKFDFIPEEEVGDVADVKFLFNSKSYQGVLLPDGSYEYLLQVEEGDIYGGEGSLSATVTDLAGNRSEYEIAADFEIDGVLPVIEISSPLSNGRYSSRTLNTSYTITGEYLPSSVVMRLNGEIVTGDSLVDLLDGIHIFSVQVEDGFGNIATKEATFEIDTSYPEYSGITNISGGPFTLGEELIIEGQTEPGARVVLEIHSDTLTMETYTDSTGKFCFKINTSNLTAGFHELFLTFYDYLGNNVRIRLDDFELIAPVVVKDETVKIAMTRPAVTSDSAPSAVVAKIGNKQIESEPELAKNAPAISSAAVTEEGLNWTLYILIFSMIILAGALLTAGYHGFEVLFGGVAKAGPQQVEKYQKDEAVEEPMKLGGGSVESPEDKSKKDREVRW